MNKCVKKEANKGDVKWRVEGEPTIPTDEKPREN